MIEAITFDLWNTLFENKSYSKNRIEFLERYLTKKNQNIRQNSIQSCYNEVFNYLEMNNLKEDFKHVYTEDRIIRMLKCLDIHLNTSEIKEISITMEEEMLKDPPLLKEGVVDTLKHLSTNYKIGLISNTGITPGKVIRKVMERYNILQYFQITVFSDEIGYNKPKRIIFQKTLEALECKPEKSIHVGDLLHTDIKGAKGYGMLSIWFNDMNQKRDLDIISDFEVKKMINIINIINYLHNNNIKRNC